MFIKPHYTYIKPEAIELILYPVLSKYNRIVKILSYDIFLKKIKQKSESEMITK
jgi:hypothetical protein